MIEQGLVIERRSDLQESVLDENAPISVDRRSDLIPRVAVLRLELRVGFDFLPQRGLGVDLLLHHDGVLEPGDASDVRLARILDSEELVVRAALVLQRALRVGPQKHLVAPYEVEDERISHVAQKFEIGDGVEAARAPGMAGDEDELPILRAGCAPLEVVGWVHGLAVLVRAEEADVEVVARILEVVGVAAEERDRHLGREDEADVGVALVAIEVVLAALVERDDVAAQAALLRRLLLNRIHDRAAGALRIGCGHVGLDGCFPALGDVLDALQDVELEVDALHFFFRRLGVVAGGDVVVLRGGDFLQAVEPDMVVRQDQAVRGYERAGAAIVEADRRLLQMIEPRLRRLEAVALLEQLPRRMVEEPHPLVGEERHREEESDRYDDGLSHSGANSTSTAAARCRRSSSSWWWGWRSSWCRSSSSSTWCRSSTAALSSASALSGSARAAARSAAAPSTARRWRS